LLASLAVIRISAAAPSVDARGVAGGDGAVLAERGAQAGHAFDGGIVADVLVVDDLDVTLAALDRDGRDLVLEAAGFLRRRRLLLRGSGVGVLLFAADLVPGRDVLGGVAHVVAVERIPEAVLQHGVDELHAPHLGAVAQVGGVRGQAHALHAAGGDDGAFTGADLLRGQCDGAQARAAHLVDAERRFTIRQPGRPRRLAGRVHALGGRQDLAEDQFVHIVGINLGALECRPQRDRTQIVRRDRAQAAVETADRRPDRRDDDDILHVLLSLLRLVPLQAAECRHWIKCGSMRRKARPSYAPSLAAMSWMSVATTSQSCSAA